MPSPTMLRKAPLVLTVLVNLTVHKALETVAKPNPTVQEKLFHFIILPLSDSTAAATKNPPASNTTSPFR